MSTEDHWYKDHLSQTGLWRGQGAVLWALSSKSIRGRCEISSAWSSKCHSCTWNESVMSTVLLVICDVTLMVTVFKLFCQEQIFSTNTSDVLAQCSSGFSISTSAFMCSCWAAWGCLTSCTSWLIHSQELSCTSRQREAKELVAVGTHLFLGSWLQSA